MSKEPSVGVINKDISYIKESLAKVDKHLTQINGHVSDLKENDIVHRTELRMVKKFFTILGVPVILYVVYEVLGRIL